MLPAIFLDRDGVIIENQAKYVRDWSQAKFIPKAIDAIANLHRKNLYKIVIVTNQSAIGRELLTLKVAQDINKVFTCVHTSLKIFAIVANLNPDYFFKLLKICL